MAKKTGRMKREAVAVPQNLAEAEQFLAEIGTAKQEIERISSNATGVIERYKARVAKKAVPFAQKMQGLFEGLYIFAESRRAELTQEGKTKTVSVVSGEFGWRLTPPSVNVTNNEKVLAELRARKLAKFIRIIEEIDKEAMLKDQETAEAVPGVSITQHEDFFAKPTEIEELAASTEKLKKRSGLNKR